jgi:hypothetical protein
MRAPCLFSTYRYQQCKFLDLPQPGLCYVLQCGGKVSTLLHKNGVPIFVFQNDKLLSKLYSSELSALLPHHHVSRSSILLQLQRKLVREAETEVGTATLYFITHKVAAGVTNRTPCTVLRCVSEGMCLHSVRLVKDMLRTREQI